MISVVPEYSNNMFEEITTREENVSRKYLAINQNFFKTGHICITELNSRQLLVSIHGISVKNNSDWIGHFWDEYKPYIAFYFPYYLGQNLYRGYVNADGYIHFEALNTTDVLCASFIVNIA